MPPQPAWILAYRPMIFSNQRCKNVLISLRNIITDFEKLPNLHWCIWSLLQIRELFNTHGLSLQDWDKIHTDWIAFHN